MPNQKGFVNLAASGLKPPKPRKQGIKASEALANLPQKPKKGRGKAKLPQATPPPDGQTNDPHAPGGIFAAFKEGLQDAIVEGIEEANKNKAPMTEGGILDAFKQGLEEGKEEGKKDLEKEKQEKGGEKKGNLIQRFGKELKEDIVDSLKERFSKKRMLHGVLGKRVGGALHRATGGSKSTRKGGGGGNDENVAELKQQTEVISKQSSILETIQSEITQIRELAVKTNTVLDHIASEITQSVTLLKGVVKSPTLEIDKEQKVEDKTEKTTTDAESKIEKLRSRAKNQNRNADGTFAKGQKAPETTPAAPSGGKGIMDMLGLGDLGKSVLSVVDSLKGIGTVIGTLSSGLLPAAGVIAAAYGGFKLGEWLNDKFKLSDKLLDGIDAVTEAVKDVKTGTVGDENTSKVATASLDAQHGKGKQITLEQYDEIKKQESTGERAFGTTMEANKRLSDEDFEKRFGHPRAGKEKANTANNVTGSGGDSTGAGASGSFDSAPTVTPVPSPTTGASTETQKPAEPPTSPSSPSPQAPQAPQAAQPAVSKQESPASSPPTSVERVTSDSAGSTSKKMEDTDKSSTSPTKIDSKTGFSTMLSALDQGGISDPTQRAALMAQIAHESAGFTAMFEKGPKSYFDKYENKKILGNNQPGDGYKFRGRGFIQLTGRDNYSRAGKALGLDLINNPDLAAQPQNAARIALWYMNTRMKGKVKDFGNVEEVTKAVNGGSNGLADRAKYFAKYKDDPSITKSGGSSNVGSAAGPVAEFAPTGEMPVNPERSPSPINDPRAADPQPRGGTPDTGGGAAPSVTPASTPDVAPAPAEKGQKLQSAVAENQDLKTQQADQKTSGSTVVSSPTTNVSQNTTQNIPIPSVRNDDSAYNRAIMAQQFIL